MEPSRIDVGKCIHQMFEERVGQMPEGIAVEDDHSRLSYSALDSRSNALAGHLCTLGVIPEVRVGIFLRPSVDVAVAVIGTLKAGGAYTALDTRYPSERLAEITRDAGLSLVVTTVDLRARLPENITPVYLDKYDTFENENRHKSAAPAVSLDNAALVRYTSGSSGHPKGVINTHRSIINRLESDDLFDVRPSDVCAVDTNFGFGTRLLYPLICGAKAVVIPADYTRDAHHLVRFLAEKGVTSMFLIPTLLREVLRLDLQILSKIHRLRVVTTGGEALTVDIIKRFDEALPSTLLINTYGSNEIGGTATMKIIKSADVSFAERSIGVPVVNTCVYVLDELGNPLEPGEKGEICVGSAHLARGYLNRPDLTAERFVPDPFSTSRGARLFRTGDLGLVNANGEIEFLGRSDRQVKIHGFRVELEEIEAVLQTHPTVHQVVAVTRNNQDSTELVAYVASYDTALTPIDLRDYMQRFVPEHMVPAIFVILDRIPTTLRGKVDYAALPEPTRQNTRATTDVNRLTVTEGILYGIWQKTLGVGSFSVQDDFLELGGDSIKAMRIAAGIRERLDLDVPVSSVFEFPTIAQLARQLALLNPKSL